MSEYLRNELPAQPDKLPVFTGVSGRWIRNRLKIFCRKNTHLWYSWLQGKRCSLPCSQDFVDRSCQDHYAKLSGPDPGIDSVIDRIFEDKTFFRVINNIRSQLRDYNPMDYDSSSNSCYENTRKGLGQRGYFHKLRDYTLRNYDDLLCMRLERRIYNFKTGYKHWVVLDVRTDIGYEDYQDSILQDYNSIVGLLSCQVEPILEPFKVRIITKGNASPYFLCKGLQRQLFQSMKDMPCFRAIGRPISPCDLIDLRKMADASDGVDWEWFSIDYSAATDGLSYQYTSQIFDFITRDFPTGKREMFRKVLGMHCLYYRNPDGEMIYKGLQNNGQLMGSILSFPILCLANLGVYLLNTQEQQSGWNDDQRLSHVLVNGDDMVYCAPRCLWDSHTSLAASVGLEMSVGKAYRHPVYLNINSTSYHYDLRRDSLKETPYQIDFFNTGLFFGIKKVQSIDEAITILDLHDKALNGVLYKFRPAFQRKFISLHKHEIKLCTHVPLNDYHDGFHRNLFLPISLGGMGIENYGSRFTVTDIQSKYSMYCLSKIGPHLATQRPLPAWETRGVSCYIPAAYQAYRKCFSAFEDGLRLKDFVKRKVLSFLSSTMNPDLISLILKRGCKQFLHTYPTGFIAYCNKPGVVMIE